MKSIVQMFPDTGEISPSDLGVAHIILAVVAASDFVNIRYVLPETLSAYLGQNDAGASAGKKVVTEKLTAFAKANRPEWAAMTTEDLWEKESIDMTALLIRWSQDQINAHNVAAASMQAPTQIFKALVASLRRKFFRN